MSSPSEPESTTFSVRGMDLKVHVWKQDNPKAIVLLYHGFLAHGRYPTVKLAASLFHKMNYHVIAPDFPGHGESPGLRGYLPSADTLIQDALKIANFAKDKFPNKKLFLAGSSMGGAIALRVAMELPESVSGVILFAPMLGIKVDSASRILLACLAACIPTLLVIPSSATSPEKQFRDEKKRQECIEDPLSIPGNKLRPASAKTCVDLATDLQNRFGDVNVPFLCMVSKEDHVVDPSGALRMYEEAKSQDKTLKQYCALHGLLCETKPMIDEIEKDIIEWIEVRSK